VLRSGWDCTLEPDAESEGGLALRLGLRMVQGLSKETADRLVETRPAWSPPRKPDRPDGAEALPSLARPAGVDHDAPGPADGAGASPRSPKPNGLDHTEPERPRGAGASARPPRPAESDHAAPDRTEGAGALARLARVARLDRAALERLAEADAFRGLGLNRRAALWEATAAEAPTALPAAEIHEPAALLPKATAGEQTVLDYTSTSLTLRHHPLALLRPRLEAENLADTRALAAARRGARLRLPGLVLVRQRPGSAKGVVFFTVEDEWGTANLVVYADRVQRFRAAVVSARLVVAEGHVERTEAAVPIIHLIVQRLHDRSDLLAGLAALDRPAAGPWRRALARADEVEKGGRCGGGPPARLPRSRDFH
jgi:error-prone DNA polymerase